MKPIFSENASGVCSRCGTSVSGGHIVFGKKGDVTGLLCPDCKDTADFFGEKKQEVTLEEENLGLFQFFLPRMFRVIGSKNIILSGELLNLLEVDKLMQNSNITVIVKNQRHTNA